jgi:hypothetical protein
VGNPPVSRRSPTEARHPDSAEFVDAYERLFVAHLRLLNRVEWGDTFQEPVGRAVSDTQAAFSAFVHEDPFEPREPKSRNAIMKANGTVQHALRDLQATARERFAPLGIPGSRYAVVLILTVKQSGGRTDEIVGALRLERHAKVLGPDTDARVVVCDDEVREGEARLRLRGSLRKLADDWETYLRLEPPGEAEVQA